MSFKEIYVKLYAPIIHVMHLLKQLPSISRFSVRNFLVPRQLDSAKMDGLEKLCSNF